MAEALDKILKPPPTKKADGIVDFVPIENNANDFDLGHIINEVSKEELIATLDCLEKEESVENKATEDPKPQNNQPVNATATSKDAVNDEPVAPKTTESSRPNNEDSENAVIPTQSIVNTLTNQNLPIIPRMIFNNSSVTINFNLQK